MMIHNEDERFQCDDCGGTDCHLCWQEQREKEKDSAIAIALEASREFIERYADVVDGKNGVPEPNRAMQVLSMIDEALL